MNHCFVHMKLNIINQLHLSKNRNNNKNCCYNASFRRCQLENFLKSFLDLALGKTFWASHVALLVKNLPIMQETRIRFLGWENPLEKEMATHSSILAWKISWTVACQAPRSWNCKSWTWNKQLNHHHQDILHKTSAFEITVLAEFSWTLPILFAPSL